MYRCSDLPGILLIHGFGGNRSEVRPLADHLRGLGCEVVSVQLPGHREDRRALGGPEAKAKLWQEFVIDQMKALRERHERVVVIGFSMGGLLATQAVTREASAFGIAMVTINTPVRYWNFLQILRNVKDGGVEAIKRYVSYGEGKSVSAMWEFQKLLSRTKLRFRNITCPLLVIQSADDDTVWPSSAISILRKSGTNSRMVMFPEGGHQILTSNAAGEVCEAIEEFIRGWIFDETSCQL